MQLGELARIAGVSGTVALIAVALLSAKSLTAYTQTGPQIRAEIAGRYRRYAAYAFLRLSSFAFAVLFWLGMLGAGTVYALYGIAAQPAPAAALVAGACGGIAVICALQFCRKLVWTPSLIMLSSLYNMMRFNLLADYLSVSRVRWLTVWVIACGLGPTAWFGWALLRDRRFDELTTLGVLYGILLLPLVIACWPRRRPAARSAPARGRRPNILMIGCDTLRTDALGCCGGTQGLSPFIDALARRGTAFTNCFTPIARTAPSLVSLFTGLWPQRLGVRTNFVTPRTATIRGAHTLAGCLRQAGYRTGAISDWAGGDFGKFDFGFESVQTPPDQWNFKYLLRQGPKDLRLFLNLFTQNRVGRRVLPELYYFAGVPVSHDLCEDACRWIADAARGERPWLLNVFLATAHPPFGSRYPYYTLYRDRNYRGASRFAMAKLADPFDIIRSQRQPREDFDLDQILALYAGCVRAFDDEVRTLVQYVERAGLGEDTIVVIYSDHGMEFFEYDTWGQGNSIRGEASNRIPLLIVDPRRPGRAAVPAVVRTMDALPTLLELCGVPVPPGVDGASLAPYLDGAAALDERTALYETGEWLARPPGQAPEHLHYPELLDLLEIPDYASSAIEIKPDYAAVVNAARDRAVRTSRWKLIYEPTRGGGRYMLFDLASDPACTQDVGARHRGVLEALKLQLARWMELSDETPLPPLAAPSGAPP